MMRLQRVGRKNDPSYRIVVTDKRTGPKSGKHVDLLGSYNPKMGNVQIDGEKAKKWLAQGVQPSVTLHNILVSQKIIDAKKINPLPRKSPLIDEEAVKKEKEQEEASAESQPVEKEEAEKVVAEAQTEEVTAKVEETPAEVSEEIAVEEEVKV